MTDARKSLAEQLAALMAYRNRPDEDAAPEPLQTNWTTVPANDNAAPEEIADLSFERELHVTPSVGEIMRQVSIGPVVRNDAGQIVSIGKLRFSDGSQHEKAYTSGPDGTMIRYDRRMPTGSMLGTREQADTALGGKAQTDAAQERSNCYFAEILGTAYPRYVKRTKRRNGRSMSADESRTNLAEAIANTPEMPPVTKFPPGLPCGSPRVAESFFGMQTSSSGAQSGSVAWQDIGQVVENRKVWAAVRRVLKAKDVAVLDTAMRAQTLADVGEAVGQAHEYARRKGGRRALLAANDNLAAAINKYEASGP